jgi:hypothetical protein
MNIDLVTCEELLNAVNERMDAKKAYFDWYSTKASIHEMNVERHVERDLKSAIALAERNIVDLATTIFSEHRTKKG